MLRYEGLCIGGHLRGQMLVHETPQYKVASKIVGASVNSYYYVPLVGLRGFWLYETETKGRQPYDDIIRVLCESYVEVNRN